ncbi:hypothetical protein J5N97_022718 [Dioscorea zingiberensis]|uniref:Pentatricopeptide repeat-containing protein n=1 Tax=Dioscorea zingiberensis TaxID=325984 RepID=A0A9D5HAU5_9LILI|nr:hypothetical protein J5N97_022718 [Dioscorea zingiberensis]
MATAILHHLCNTPSIPPQTITPPSSTTLKSKRHNSLLARPLTFLSNSGRMDEALKLFSTATKPDTFLCNIMIRGYTDNGLFSEAIEFYHEMQTLRRRPDHFTFPFVLKSCTALSCFIDGVKMHAVIFKLGLDSDVFISNSLISFYAKLGLVDSAERVFDEMPVRDLVSWNSMIGGYVLNCEVSSAVLSFQEMQIVHGLKPDQFAIMNALEICSLEKSVIQGKAAHCFALKHGLDLEIKVQASVVDLYCKCGNLLYAERYFCNIHNANIVAWNALIGGYVLNEEADKAISCLQKMQVNSIDVDAVTLVNLLPCCAPTAAHFYKGKAIHGLAIRRNFLPHIVLETALVDMYAKCGALRQAELLFNLMDLRSQVSWNTMFTAYVQNGKYAEALELFLEHLKGGALYPDLFTFSCVIPAYAELASLRHGMQIHANAIKLGYGRNVIVSNAITHMYAKCGDIQTSRRTFDRIEYKDIVSWNTIIMCYGIHGQGKTALNLFTRMQENGFKPNKSSFLSVLRACSISGLVDEGWKHFNSMQQNHNISPQIEHYGCMVDILGFSGDLKMAIDFIDRMPMTPTARIWGSLLTASRNNKNIEVAEFAAKHIFRLKNDNTGCYVLLSSMYADAGRWNEVEVLRRLMRERGLQRTTGRSLVELNSKTCSFIDGDKSHKVSFLIHEVLDILPSRISVGTCGSLTRRHSVRLAVSFGLISSSVGAPVLVKKNIKMEKQAAAKAKTNTIFKLLSKHTFTILLGKPPCTSYNMKLKTVNKRSFSCRRDQVMHKSKQKKKHDTDAEDHPTSPKISWVCRLLQKKKVRKTSKLKSSSQKKIHTRVRPRQRLYDNRLNVLARAQTSVQIRRLASRHETFKKFDLRVFYEDLEKDSEEVIVDHMSSLHLGCTGDDVCLEPRKEVNLWKRRTKPPPPPLQLN